MLACDVDAFSEACRAALCDNPLASAEARVRSAGIPSCSMARESGPGVARRLRSCRFQRCSRTLRRRMWSLRMPAPEASCGLRGPDMCRLCYRVSRISESTPTTTRWNSFESSRTAVVSTSFVTCFYSKRPSPRRLLAALAPSEARGTQRACARGPAGRVSTSDAGYYREAR